MGKQKEVKTRIVKNFDGYRTYYTPQTKFLFIWVNFSSTHDNTLKFSTIEAAREWLDRLAQEELNSKRFVVEKRVYRSLDNK